MSHASPLVLDIDGTLTRPEGGIDPRVFEPVRDWPAPVVLATGKAFPYPIALCTFVAIEERVIAENGGIAHVNDEVLVHGDRQRTTAAIEAFQDAGGDLGWGDVDLVNRWRETEVAIRLDADEELLRSVAAEHGLEVVDTGYAYHLKQPDMSKGLMLERVAELMGYEPSAFVAIGDSENDVSTFERAGRSFAPSNADERALSAADVVLDGAHAEGTLAALDRLRSAE
ncbi:HAD hydrolase family protein [Haloarchaeobius salinus]|uniref:HAD hydrolase family protein n=1 Tax=Haloarchaeobius salinus TaxID=1198298 RepID=UPI00210A2B78|nr:HAD hydrolase family protein [Haloarchaeobius salinus]